MGEYFAGNYSGDPFQLFGAPHLTALAIIALLNVGLLRLKRQPNPARQTRIRYELAALLVINEAAWHLWHIYIGVWNVQTMLPLHLCSVLVFVSAIMLVTKNYTLYEFAYFMGISGATQALLTPDAGPYGFPHFRFFQVFISHGAIVTAAIYMTMVEGYRPQWKSLLRVMVGMNLYMAAVGVVNWWLGSNYMFIAHKPYTPSLLDYLGPWPWYILSIEALGLTLCLLLYLPFARQNAANRAVSTTNG